MLFVLAVGFVLTQGREVAALFDAFRAEPLSHQIAWLIIVLVPLVLLPSVVWLCDTLVRQRQAAHALELRLDGVRQGARELTKSQVDAEAGAYHLARTDPENAISSVQQRLTEAERIAQVQQNRNEIGDLQSRVDAVRAQQQALQERLAPVLDKRRMVEQLFAELDGRQNDIGRALAEIATGDDAVALDLRLKNLSEFLKLSHGRCDEIERAAKASVDLKAAFAGLRTRLDPLAAANSGVTGRIKELNLIRSDLAAEIDALLRTPDGDLAGQVQKFTDDKRKLGDGVARLEEQFAKLSTLRQDALGLFADLDHALNVLAPGPGDASAADVDSRVDELATFIKGTTARFEDIEQRLIVFGQLKTKMGDLQARLVPLEAADGGVVVLVKDLQLLREKLDEKLKHIEADQSGDLAERVKAFTEAKRALEERVANAAGHFDHLEQRMSDFAQLKTKLGDLQTRLVPLEAVEGGVVNLVQELQQLRDRLDAKLKHIEAAEGGELDERVKAFTEAKRELEARVSSAAGHLDHLEQRMVDFGQLKTKLGELQARLAPLDAADGGVVNLVKELQQVRDRLDAKLTHIEANEGGELDERVKAFAEAKHDLEHRVSIAAGHLDHLEQRMIDFSQLKTKLGDLQTRLVPLEAPDGGVINLVSDLQQLRDRLDAKLKHIEADEAGDLAQRVKAFTDAKRELEERVSVATEHFSRLHTIRKDIAGLFDKLGSVVGPASN